MAILGPARENTFTGDINQILAKLYSQEGKGEETQIVKDALQSYSGKIFNSFDNPSFESNMGNLDNWYNQNFDNLTDAEISRYNLIKRRAGEHKTKFNTFDASYQMMHDNMEEMKVLISGGVIDGNPVTGFNDLDDDGKALVANIIKEKELKYIANKETMVKKFGDLLQHPSGKFITEAIALDSWDDIYRLGLVSIKDQVVDPHELYAISESIDYGNLDEHKNYMQGKEETNKSARNFHMNNSIPLIEEVNYKGEFLDNYEYIINLHTAASDGDEDAEATLNLIKDSFVHTTEYPRNPYAQAFPATIGVVDLTWQNLLDGEGDVLRKIYEEDLRSLNKKLYVSDQGFQNVSVGQSLTNIAPITYKPWNNKISDPYQRIVFEKDENKSNVPNMTVEENNLIQDYKTDLARKKELDKWFEDYPYAGSSPQEKTEMEDKKLGGQLIYRSNLNKEWKALKTKWFKKKKETYSGVTYELKPQSMVFQIAKRYRLQDIDRMFE